MEGLEDIQRSAHKFKGGSYASKLYRAACIKKLCVRAVSFAMAAAFSHSKESGFELLRLFDKYGEFNPYDFID